MREFITDEELEEMIDECDEFQNANGIDIDNVSLDFYLVKRALAELKLRRKWLLE